MEKLVFFVVLSLGLGFISVVECVCENQGGDAWCGNKLAVADYCTLDMNMRCQCHKACNATPECNDRAVDQDLSCDCPFYSSRCPNDNQMAQGCFTTCQLKMSVTCPNPRVAVPNSSLQYNRAPASGSAKYMDEATLACDTGYEAVNSSSRPMRRVCDKNGNWVLDPDQQKLVCTRKRCGAPTAVAQATPSLAIGYYGDHVTYACAQGHTKVAGGSGKRVCNASGQWEGDTANPPPTCIAMNERFINSKNEAQVAPPGSMTSLRTRSGLKCASECAQRALCYGYTYSQHTNTCQMNTGAPNTVVTLMKKI